MLEQDTRPKAFGETALWYARRGALCSKDRDPAGAAEANRWLGQFYPGTIAGNRRQ
jgi:hypothetical protein